MNYINNDHKKQIVPKMYVSKNMMDLNPRGLIQFNHMIFVPIIIY